MGMFEMAPLFGGSSFFLGSGSCTHSIHVWFLPFFTYRFGYVWLILWYINVGKYTRPMDGTGYILTMVSKPPKWGWSISKWLGLPHPTNPTKSNLWDFEAPKDPPRSISAGK